MVFYLVLRDPPVFVMSSNPYTEPFSSTEASSDRAS